MENALTLLRIIMDYAKSDKDRASIDRMWIALNEDKVAPRDMVKVLAGVLHDGLAYGNWPTY